MLLGNKVDKIDQRDDHGNKVARYTGNKVDIWIYIDLH